MLQGKVKAEVAVFAHLTKYLPHPPRLTHIGSVEFYAVLQRKERAEVAVFGKMLFLTSTAVTAG